MDFSRRSVTQIILYITLPTYLLMNETPLLTHGESHDGLGRISASRPVPTMGCGRASHPQVKILSENHQICHFCQQVCLAFCTLGTQEEGAAA